MRYYESFEEHCTCTNNKWDCEWTQEIKLQASDKQVLSGFGRSVSVDQRAKIIAVGADQVVTTDATGASLYGDKPRNSGAVYLYTQATEFREATGQQVRGRSAMLSERSILGPFDPCSRVFPPHHLHPLMHSDILSGVGVELSIDSQYPRQSRCAALRCLDVPTSSAAWRCGHGTNEDTTNWSAWRK